MISVSGAWAALFALGSHAGRFPGALALAGAPWAARAPPWPDVLPVGLWKLSDLSGLSGIWHPSPCDHQSQDMGRRLDLSPHAADGSDLRVSADGCVPPQGGMCRSACPMPGRSPCRSGPKMGSIAFSSPLSSPTRHFLLACAPPPRDQWWCQGDTMTHIPYLFHQTTEQMRRIGARGGKTQARNRRARQRAGMRSLSKGRTCRSAGPLAGRSTCRFRQQAGSSPGYRGHWGGPTHGVLEELIRQAAQGSRILVILGL